MHICTYTCTYISCLRHVYAVRDQACICTYIHTHIPNAVNSQLQTSPGAQSLLLTQIHMYMHAYIYLMHGTRIHICTYVHTYIHTYLRQ